MATITKTFLTEVLIRFSTGMEHQTKKPGELEAVHAIKRECIVDDATGEILGETRNRLNGQPQPIDPAEVTPLLGEQFVTFSAQLEEAKKKAAEDAATASATISSLTKRLNAAISAHGSLAKQHADIAATLAEPEEASGGPGPR